MITGQILSIFYNFVAYIVNLFPDGSIGIPSGFIEAITLGVSYLHSFSWLLPVDNALIVAITTISFYVIIMIIKIGLWVVKTVRGTA